MRALLFAFLLAGCSDAVIDLPTASSGASASRTPSAVSAVNAERAKRGRGPVVWDSSLARAAAGHAQDMSANQFFSHRSRDGSDFADRVEATGYDACFGAENIAVGQTSLEQVMREWMESPGHRRNILNGKAQEVGVARANGNYWVMVLAATC